MSFFNSLKLLLPRTKPWNLSVDGILRRFFLGLSEFPEDVKKETELVYFDLFPESTRALSEWENQFQVLFADEKFGDTRRAILDALWKVNQGGQTAQYLQNFLRKIVPGIYVTENSPVRNPTDANQAYDMVCGCDIAICGYEAAVCGGMFGDVGVQPYVIMNDAQAEYNLPAEDAYWQNCFYVSGPVLRDGSGKIICVTSIKVNAKWKKFIDYFTLKIKPAQTTALIYIDWVEEEENA